MSRLTNQLTVTVAGLRGPGLDSADVAVIEGATQEARRAAGFPTLSEANTFAPNMTTGQRTTVSTTDTGTHAAVAGEVRLDGTAATVGEAIPNAGVYEKQAGGALLRVGSTEDQLAGVQAVRAEAARVGTEQSMASLYTQSPATIGPTGTLTAGSAISLQPQFFLDAVPGAGILPSITLFDAKAGPVEVAVYRMVAGTLTLQATASATATGAAAEVTLALSSVLNLLPNDILAVRALVGGVYTFVNGVTGSGQYNYPTAGAFPATVTLGGATIITSQVRFNITLRTQVVTASKITQIEARSGTSATPIALATADYPARYLDGSGWNGLISYGQSNSNGVNARPAISTAQPYANLTFGSGVRAARAGNSWGALNTSPGTATSKPLIEENSSADVPAADGWNASGETLCTGAASTICELSYINEGIDPASFIWFVSAPGHTGYSIANLRKGSAWYNNLISHVTDARALAVAAGKGYKVPAIVFVQGEENARTGSSYASYKPQLPQLAADMDADIRAITGQTEPVHTLIWQIAGSNGSGTLARVAEIRRAQFDAVNEATRLLHMISPMYYLAGASDRIHVTSASQLRMGRISGRAIRQLVMSRIKPDVLWPIRAYARGTELRVKFRVPKSPLVLDAASLGGVVDSGFRVVDDAGALTLSNVRVSTQGDEIVLTLNRALGTNPAVRYALDYATPITNLTLCAGGTLRDSTPDSTVIEGVTYPMFHVCPAFQKPVVVLEAQT